MFLLFEALMFAIEYPDAAKLKVFYFALEETDERILHRFESYLLMKLDKIRISPRDLRSTDNSKPVPQEILNLLNSEKYQIYIRKFEETFSFSNVANPTGVYKMCKQYAEETGKTYTKKYTAKNEFGEMQEYEGAFDYYVMDNPNEFRFVVLDHCGLIQPEKGMSIKESIDKMSKYFVELRNRYNFSPILIQQQSTVNESNESFKLKAVRPSGRGLSDSSYTQRDANTLLGLFSPFKFGIESFMEYDCKIFKDNIRFLEVCNSRDGQVGGIIALFFDGVCNMFYELPKPNDPAINKWYEYIRTLNN